MPDRFGDPNVTPEPEHVDEPQPPASDETRNTCMDQIRAVLGKGGEA